MSGVPAETSRVRFALLLCLLTLGLTLGITAGVAPAAAAGPATRTAIAPVQTGRHVAAPVQRAFQEELTRVLGETWPLAAPNEVDMRVAEKPELIRCTLGPCLTDEAALLGVERIVVPRLEPLHDPATVGVELGLSLFDLAAGKVIAAIEVRCAPCDAAAIRRSVREAIPLLQAALARALNPMAVAVAAGAELQGKPSGRRAHRFRVVKWIALAAGLAAAAVGAGLWAVDGQGSCSLAPGQKECPMLYDTLPAGAGLVGTGGALVLTSIVMIGLDARF